MIDHLGYVSSMMMSHEKKQHTMSTGIEDHSMPCYVLGIYTHGTE